MNQCQYREHRRYAQEGRHPFRKQSPQQPPYRGPSGDTADPLLGRPRIKLFIDH